MATKNDVERIIAMLSLAYPSYESHKTPQQICATIDLYHRFLRDVETPILEAAAMQHITSSKWFPSVYELREAALSLVNHGESSAEEAWLEVKKTISRVGYYGVPQFSDAKILRAVEAIGWRELCLTPIETEGVTRAHFMRIYDSLKNRQRMEHLTLPEIRSVIERKKIER